MNNVNLSTPWDIYFSKLCALFDHDPEITLAFNRNAYTITITSTSDDKADALRQIVPNEVEMGNITLTINVEANVPSNPGDLYERAFKGNPIFAKVETYPLPTGDPAYFVEFFNQAACYYADDLTNPQGLQFELYQDIARDTLNHDSVFITSINNED